MFVAPMQSLRTPVYAPMPAKATQGRPKKTRQGSFF